MKALSLTLIFLVACASPEESGHIDLGRLEENRVYQELLYRCAKSLKQSVCRKGYDCDIYIRYNGGLYKCP